MFITSRISFNQQTGIDVGEQRIAETHDEAIECGVVMAKKTPPGDDIDVVAWTEEVRTALKEDNYFCSQGEDWILAIGQASTD